MEQHVTCNSQSPCLHKHINKVINVVLNQKLSHNLLWNQMINKIEIVMGNIIFLIMCSLALCSNGNIPKTQSHP